MTIQAPVNKIIPFSSVDGPGNRTAVFFQGCNQNCLYCHNPETIHMCNHCGVCVSACPAKALAMETGVVTYDPQTCVNCDTCIKCCTRFASPKIINMTPDLLFDRVREYFPFLSGITTSGGECGLYLDFLTEFYSLVKQTGKTTFMDTNGQIPLWDKPDFLKTMDKAMIDLKAGTQEDYQKLTDGNLENPVSNIRHLADMGKLYEIRTVVVPGAADNRKTVELGSSLIRSYPQIRYKLIQFRPYGVRDSFSKTPQPTREMMEELKELALSAGVKEVIVT